MRRLRRNKWLMYPLLTVGGLTLLLGIAYGVFKWRFIPSVPEPDFPTPSTQIEAYEQDLSYLELYASLDKAFDDPAKKESFYRFIESVRADLASMTPERFELAVARAVALADNGHSNVSPISLTRRMSRLPVRTGPFEDGQYVLQAMNDYTDLLGAELIAVEGHPVADVASAFVPNFGGVERRSRFFTHLFINLPALLHAAGFTASPDGATLTFRLPDASVREIYLPASPPPEGRRLPYGREVMDYRVPQEDADEWTHLMAGRPPPLYLAEPDEPYLYEYMDEQNGAYVKINFNWDIGDRSLSGWLKEVEADLRGREPQFAVVDLRFNGGGTDATNRFAEQLPSLVKNNGNIYIVISRQTFSAGIGAAAQLKRFAGDRAKVVGGAAGDRLRFVANGGTLFKLPNSGISTRVWSSWEDYADGCWDWRECFWLSPFFKREGVGNLDPDITVPVSFADYVLNRDAAMDAILSDNVTQGR